MSDLSRNGFLKLVRGGFLWLSAALGLGGLLRFLNYDPNPAPQSEFDLGPATNFPLGTRTGIADGQFVLIHDELGLRAINTTCTHLGCQTAPGPDGFTCPCHGSHFDLRGDVLQGPAAKALNVPSVELNDGGHLILHD